jgi:hypothetical protein
MCTHVCHHDNISLSSFFNRQYDPRTGYAATSSDVVHPAFGKNRDWLEEYLEEQNANYEINAAAATAMNVTTAATTAVAAVAAAATTPEVGVDKTVDSMDSSLTTTTTTTTQALLSESSQMMEVDPHSSTLIVNQDSFPMTTTSLVACANPVHTPSPPPPAAAAAAAPPPPSSIEVSSSHGGPWLGQVIDDVWEIREIYLLPALTYVLNGLKKSGHIDEVETEGGGGRIRTSYVASNRYKNKNKNKNKKQCRVRVLSLGSNNNKSF